MFKNNSARAYKCDSFFWETLDFQSESYVLQNDAESAHDSGFPISTNSVSGFGLPESLACCMYSVCSSKKGDIKGVTCSLLRLLKKSSATYLKDV